MPREHAVPLADQRGDPGVSTVGAEKDTNTHLHLLEASGLVRSEKQGRVRTCRVEPGALAVAEGWIAKQRAVWEGRLDRLEGRIERIERRLDLVQAP